MITRSSTLKSMFKPVLIVVSIGFLGTSTLFAQQFPNMTYEESRLITGDYKLPEFTGVSDDTLLTRYLMITYEQSDALRAAFNGWVAIRSRSEQDGYLPVPEVMFR